jgi:hypothetical protein
MDEPLLVEIVPDLSTTFPTIIIRCHGCGEATEFSIACDFGSLARFYKEHKWCRR